MKKIFLLALMLGSLAFLAMKQSPNKNNPLQGAWKLSHNGLDYVLVFQDGYSMFTQYSLDNKKFVLTTGGPYTAEANKIKVKVQFNSADKSDAGKSFEYGYKIDGDALTTETGNGFSLTWERIDEGDKNLAGNWRIIQRKQDDQMVDIPLRARRTLKLLTSTRFQWAAINIETGEFFGTGGGTYTFKKGKYIENIDFFSRDSTRVGMSLNFEGKLDNGNWIHSGKSSKGDPIYEVWSRMKE